MIDLAQCRGSLVAELRAVEEEAKSLQARWRELVRRSHELVGALQLADQLLAAAGDAEAEAP